MVSFEEMRKNPRLADPFRRPDWRYKRVLRMVSRMPSPGRTTRHDDKYIKGARSFMLRWKKGEAERDRLLYENPGMYHAWCVFDNIEKDADFQFIMEARLLSGQTPEAIAFESCVLPETVEWYEKVFFNVKDSLGHHDWILKHVLLPSLVRNHEPDDDDNADGLNYSSPPVVKPHMDSTLKFFSYFGGPIICEFMLSGFKRGLHCHAWEKIGEWLDESMMDSIRRRTAQAAQVFDINKYNVMELVQVHTRIVEIQRSAESQEDKHSAIENHVHGMLAEIPWTVGHDAREVFEGTVIGQLDDVAAETNAEELMLLGAGQQPLDIEDLPAMSIATRNKEDLENKDAKNTESK